MSVRPLKCVEPGVWRSGDGEWTFLMHFSDPRPRRWFAYRGEASLPENDGLGHASLREAVAWAETGGYPADQIVTHPEILRW